MHDVEKEAVMPLFVTFVNVQGSQTQATYNQAYNVFKTYHKLQGSQTKMEYKECTGSLRHIINYKVLKLCKFRHFKNLCLRHIINYKVLKQVGLSNGRTVSLRHIINYKVLKLFIL